MSSVSALEFFGNAVNVSVTSSPYILDLRARVWRVTTSSAGFFVRFPAQTTPGLVFGGPMFIICNVGSNSFSVGDFEAVDIPIAVGAGKAVVVSAWRSGVSTVKFAPAISINYGSY